METACLLEDRSCPAKIRLDGHSYTSPNLANKIVATEWTPEGRHVKALVEKHWLTFDSLNLNLYRGPSRLHRLHSDGEKEGLWGFPIASVSLGAVRRFKWRNKKDGLTTTQELAHGSLLVMPAEIPV